MDQASDAKLLASRNDFLTLDSTTLANKNSNQDMKFGNGRGKRHKMLRLYSFDIILQ